MVDSQSQKYLNLGYVKLDDLTKFNYAYFSILGDDSVFVEPPPFVQPPSVNNTLLDDHDGFALNPKKLVKNYQDNRDEPKTKQMVFFHMTNHITNEHCVAANNKNGHFVDLEPLDGLDVSMK